MNYACTSPLVVCFYSEIPVHSFGHPSWFLLHHLKTWCIPQTVLFVRAECSVPLHSLEHVRHIPDIRKNYTSSGTAPPERFIQADYLFFT
jgi:hypothetical protein